MAKRHSSMNISLPTSLRSVVRKRMKSRGFANASEYMRHLIRLDVDEPDSERLRALIREGLDSGPATPMTRDDWDAIRQRGAARAKELRASRRRSA